jgi:hypothetical protein
MKFFNVAITAAASVSTKAENVPDQPCRAQICVLSMVAADGSTGAGF